MQLLHGKFIVLAGRWTYFPNIIHVPIVTLQTVFYPLDIVATSFRVKIAAIHFMIMML